jgi:hypothetical protein
LLLTLLVVCRRQQQDRIHRSMALGSSLVSYALTALHRAGVAGFAQTAAATTAGAAAASTHASLYGSVDAIQHASPLAATRPQLLKTIFGVEHSADRIPSAAAAASSKEEKKASGFSLMDSSHAAHSAPLMDKLCTVLCSYAFAAHYPAAKSAALEAMNLEEDEISSAAFGGVDPLGFVDESGGESKRASAASPDLGDLRAAATNVYVAALCLAELSLYLTLCRCAGSTLWM